MKCLICNQEILEVESSVKVHRDDRIKGYAHTDCFQSCETGPVCPCGEPIKSDQVYIRWQIMKGAESLSTLVYHTECWNKLIKGELQIEQPIQPDSE